MVLQDPNTFGTRAMKEAEHAWFYLCETSCILRRGKVNLSHIQLIVIVTIDKRDQFMHCYSSRRHHIAMT